MHHGLQLINMAAKKSLTTNYGFQQREQLKIELTKLLCYIVTVSHFWLGSSLQSVALAASK